MAVNFPVNYKTEKVVIRCVGCNLPHTINSIRHQNGTPVCECGTAIKNAPQEWKKN